MRSATRAARLQQRVLERAAVRYGQASLPEPRHAHSLREQSYAQASRESSAPAAPRHACTAPLPGRLCIARLSLVPRLQSMHDMHATYLDTRVAFLHVGMHLSCACLDAEVTFGKLHVHRCVLSLGW